MGGCCMRDRWMDRTHCKEAYAYHSNKNNNWMPIAKGQKLIKCRIQLTRHGIRSQKKKKRSILLEQKSNYLFNCTMDKIEYIAQETLLKKKIK